MSVVPPDHLASLQSGDSSRKKSGRAVAGERGHTVWEWQTATGVFQRDVSDEQLHRLQAPHLEIVESAADTGQHEVWNALSTNRMNAQPSSPPSTRVGALRGLWRKLRDF
jgi:hypothetical protein